jgi:hypothetical protein
VAGVILYLLGSWVVLNISVVGVVAALVRRAERRARCVG